MKRPAGIDTDQKGYLKMGFELLYEKKDDSIKILRCFGETKEITLPDQIGGFPVTELGDYIFSEGMRTEPKGFLWRESGMKEETEYRAGELSEPAVCGPSLRSVRLPACLRRIGRYAFYNCDGLKSLAFPSAIRDIGAGAFNGCRKIEELTVEADPEKKSCLKEILSELNETVAVHYREKEENRREALAAELLFPAFYEEAVENTPARITETHVHGCGHRYRYCFENTQLLFREYDSLFPYMKAQENVPEAVKMAADRLRFPLRLSEAAERTYKIYLLEHLAETGEYIASLSDAAEWDWLVNQCFGIKRVEHAAAVWLGNEGLAGRAHEEYSNIKEPVLGKTGFDKLVETASRLNQTEAVSILMEAGHRAFPPKRRKFELL